jgi:hypothetical protein
LLPLLWVCLLLRLLLKLLQPQHLLQRLLQLQLHRNHRCSSENSSP